MKYLVSKFLSKIMNTVVSIDVARGDNSTKISVDYEFCFTKRLLRSQKSVSIRQFDAAQIIAIAIAIARLINANHIDISTIGIGVCLADFFEAKNPKSIVVRSAKKNTRRFDAAQIKNKE